MKPYITFLFAILVASSLARGSEKDISSVENRVKTVFQGCKRTSGDLKLRLDQAGSLSDQWATSLPKDTWRSHLYDSSFKGQILTLLVPYVARSEDLPTAEMAKSCWAEYEDWRRDLGDTSKKKSDLEREYNGWIACLSTLYPENIKKLELLTLIEACKP